MNTNFKFFPEISNIDYNSVKNVLQSELEQENFENFISDKLILREYIELVRDYIDNENNITKDKFSMLSINTERFPYALYNAYMGIYHSIENYVVYLDELSVLINSFINFRDKIYSVAESKTQLKSKILDTISKLAEFEKLEEKCYLQ